MRILERPGALWSIRRGRARGDAGGIRRGSGATDGGQASISAFAGPAPCALVIAARARFCALRRVGSRGARVKFFALTFALTWAAWAAAAAIPARGGPLAALRGAVFLLGVFAPALMALALAALAESRAAAWVLVGRIGRWRVGA